MTKLKVLAALEELPALRERLLRLEELFVANDQIEAVAIRGSVARGEADRFADLDFTVVATDRDWEEVMSDREGFFRQAGDLTHSFISTTDTPRIFVGWYSDLVEVNAHYVKASEVNPEPSGGDWCVLKDSTGWLTLVVEESARLPLPRPAAVDDPEERFWLWVYRTVARVHRGELWHAWDMLNDIRELLMKLLTHTSGRPYIGFRQFPRTLDRTDERWLAATVCSLDARAILQAASAAVGLYVSLRARRGEQPTAPQVENKVLRLLQETGGRTR